MPSRKNKIDVQSTDLSLQRELQETREMLAVTRSEVELLRNKMSSIQRNDENKTKFDFEALFPERYECNGDSFDAWTAYPGESLQYSDRKNHTNSPQYSSNTDNAKPYTPSDLSGDWTEEPLECNSEPGSESKEGRGERGSLIEREH